MERLDNEELWLSDDWSARLAGGWLVLMRRGQDRYAAAATAIDTIEYSPHRRRGRLGTLQLEVASHAFRCRADELAAARLRRAWHELLELRLGLPRACDVADLLRDPEGHGGRRWVSHVAIATVDDGTARIVPGLAEPDGDPPQGYLELRLPERPTRAQPRLTRGIATYTFEWDGPVLQHRSDWHRIGILNVERLRPAEQTPETRVPTPPPELGGTSEAI